MAVTNTARTQQVFSFRITLSLIAMALATPIYANDKCASDNTPKLGNAIPIKCQAEYHELYKQSVSDKVFKASDVLDNVNSEIKTIKPILAEENRQIGLYEYISEDSEIDGRVKIRNKIFLIIKNFFAVAAFN